MKAFILACSLLSLLAVGLPTHAETNDFNKVCGYFQALSENTEVDKMSHLERNRFIVDRINKNLPETSNARVAWDAVSHAVATQRYELYQAAAESVTNKKWRCKAMEKLVLKTGQFKD